jgi:predicted nucleic acid-binding protein
MVLYIESSAVLAWLLGEPPAKRILDILHAAEQVVSSALTPVECARGLTRARLLERLTSIQELAALQLLDQAESMWHIQELTAQVLARAREPMPGDPVRTLDALHIASAIVLRDGLGPISMLSLDARVRACATGLGFPVVP